MELPIVSQTGDESGCPCADSATTLTMCYRGVLVPGDLRPKWWNNDPEVMWWRRGVDAALYKEERSK